MSRIAALLLMQLLPLAASENGAAQGAQPQATRRASPYQLARDRQLPPVGTAHPILVKWVSTDGSTVAACQSRLDTDGDGQTTLRLARHGIPVGDRPFLFLMTRGASGSVVDQLYESDPSRRYLTYRHSGVVDLFDSQRPEELAQPPHPLFLFTREEQDGVGLTSFDASGRHLLFARLSDELGGVSEQGESIWGSDTLWLRDLTTGADQQIDMGSMERLVAAQLLAGGAFVSLVGVARDTNGNGILDPAPIATGNRFEPGPCGGIYHWTGVFDGSAVRGPGRYDARYSDALHYEVIAINGRQRLPGRLFASTATGVLMKQPTGALQWFGADGSSEDVAPSECNPRYLVGVAAAHMAFALVCADGGTYRYRGGEPRTGAPEPTVAPLPFQRFSNAGEFYYDLVSGEATPAGGEGFRYGVINSSGAAVEWREDGALRFVRWNGESAPVRHPLLPPDPRRANTTFSARWYGKWLVYDWDSHAVVVDLEAGTVRGSLPEAPAFVRADGFALVPSGTRHGTPLGPLRWYQPPGH